MEGIEIKIVRKGQSPTHEVHVLEDGNIIFADRCKIVDAEKRQELIERIVEKLPALPSDEIEKAILDQIQIQQTANAKGTPLSDDVIVVAPERFIIEDVNAIGVPNLFLADDGIQMQFELFVQHAGGEREKLDLERTLNIDGSHQLIVDPLPSIVGTPMSATWSPQARSEWLEGKEPPTVQQVFEAVCELISNHVCFPDYERPAAAYAKRSRQEWIKHDQAVWSAILTIWVMLTFAYPVLPAVAYLWLSGHAGSGKTRLLEVLALLVFRPLLTSSCTPAAVFRSLHELGGTLMVDEGERLNYGRDGANQELISILNAGYRPGAMVTRCEEVKKKHVVRAYRCFGPKCIASIGQISDTLASRSIPIKMLRARCGYARRLNHRDQSWQGARDMLYEFSLAHGPKWLEIAADEDILDLGGREFEIWGPIVATAKWIGPEVGIPNLVEMIAEHIELSRSASSSSVVVSERDQHVMRTLAKLLAEQEDVQCKQVLDAARKADPLLMQNMTARRVSAILERVGISTEKDRRRPVYTKSVRHRLARVQDEYGVDLGLNGEEIHQATGDEGGPDAG